MTKYNEAQRKLIVASLALGRAQSDLEEAEARFKAALDLVESIEQETIPNFREMRGILK